MSDQSPTPSRFQVWKLAARPQTLTASIVPAFVGLASILQLTHFTNSEPFQNQRQQRSCNTDADASGDSTCPASYEFRDVAAISPYSSLLPLAIQFAAFAGLIQLSTNLHNDYADFVKGADNDERVGQARATQKGWLTPYETCRGCALCLFGALWIGVYYLIPLNNQCTDELFAMKVKGVEFDPVIVFVVLSSLFNAVAYTGGPFPLGYIGLANVSIGYSGLGDLFVFLYFGIVATMGVPYLYATKVVCIPQRLLPELLYPSFLCSLPVGFLATAIIVVNNLRDRHTDIRAGKKTMAARFGATFARVEYFLLVVGSYWFSIYFWILDKGMYTTLLPLLSFPMAISQLKAVSFGGKDGQALNEHVGATARLQMVYCALMTFSLYMSSEQKEPGMSSSRDSTVATTIS